MAPIWNENNDEQVEIEGYDPYNPWRIIKNGFVSLAVIAVLVIAYYFLR